MSVIDGNVAADYAFDLIASGEHEPVGSDIRSEHIDIISIETRGS